MGAVGVQKSAAVCAQHLDRLLGSNRPLRDGLVGHSVHYRLAVRLDQLRGVVRLQVLHGSLRNQGQGIDDADRQQHPQGGAGHIDPEIADGLFFLASDAANECDRQRNPHRRGGEVMVGQASHLGEIAHGGLARIVLPIRVGGERRGGIKRQRWRHAGKLLRIPPRQQMLRPLQQVKQQHRCAAEQ